MKSKLIKEFLGEQLQDCTRENFEVGFDHITELVDNYESNSLTIEEFENEAKEAVCDFPNNKNNIDEQEEQYYDTAPFSIYTLINRCYSENDSDYLTIYEHLDLGAWYFYSKYINDLFRISEKDKRLNWLKNEPNWYNHYFGQFCQTYFSELENSCNPEYLDDAIFAPYIEDELGVFEDED